MRRHWWRFGLTMLVWLTIAIAIGGFIVMLLWNWVMPAVFGLGTLGYLQALGLLVLARVLVGARPGRGGRFRGGRHWRRRMHERWAGMSEDERAKFREMMRSRCGRTAPDEAGPPAAGSRGEAGPPAAGSRGEAGPPAGA